MLSAFLIADSAALATYLNRTCASGGDIVIEKSTDTYPSSYVLGRMLGIHTPEAIFLEVGPAETFRELERTLTQIRAALPSAAVVPVCWSLDPGTEQMAGRMGLIAPLAPPFSSDDLESAALRALDRAVHGAAAPLVLFVPARQGSGATTIALNTAYQLCDVGGYRTLFVEVDDNEGALGAILPAAAEPVSLEASYFTPFSFRQHVQRIGELDVVSGRRLAGVTGLNRWTVRRFLAAARSHYDYVLVRTPRLSHPGISTSLPSVTRTVIVATPDLPSLSVARDMSARLGQARRTVSIVMNRWDVDCAASNTAALFPAEVLSTVPDAATLVRRAQMSHNGVVSTDGPFLRAVAKIGSAIAGAPLRGRDVPNKWSLGFFSKVFTPAEV